MQVISPQDPEVGLHHPTVEYKRFHHQAFSGLYTETTLKFSNKHLPSQSCERPSTRSRCSYWHLRPRILLPDLVPSILVLLPPHTEPAFPHEKVKASPTVERKARC